MDLQEIDPEQFRLTQDKIPIPKLSQSRSTSTPRQKFLRGPIPLWWLQAAGGLPGKAIHVGVELWYQAGLCSSKVIRFSYKSVQQFGVKRHAAYRALKSLGGARLVAVYRAPGRCPIVTLLIGNGTAKDLNPEEPGFHQKS